jgi:hypothetical protein
VGRADHSAYPATDSGHIGPRVFPSDVRGLIKQYFRKHRASGSSCPYVHPPSVSFHVQPKAIHLVQCHHPSAVRVNLRPTSIDFIPLLLRHLSVLGRAIQALGAQTHVDFVFEVRAHPYRLPHEAFGLAFVERGHDLFAA